jgi:L-threonylcarbamoyladenylate synthase
MSSTRLFSLSDPNKLLIEKVAKECSSIIRQKSRIGLIPTETVYGIVCKWQDYAAYEKILEMKKRPKEKNFQMLALSLEDAEQFGFCLNEKIKHVAKRFFPGPLTLIAHSKSTNEGIGLRIPSHPFARALLAKLSFPLAATSANISGEKNFMDFAPILPSLGTKIDFAVDAGQVSGDASTVLDLRTDEAKILRHGKIPDDMIFKVLLECKLTQE